MGTPFKMSGPSLYSSPTKSIAKTAYRVAKKVVKFKAGSDLQSSVNH